MTKLSRLVALDISPKPAAGRKRGSEVLQIGIAGRFDVKNYGDLLFPLIAQAALEKRDPRLRVRPFSPNARETETWPYKVETLSDLPRLSGELAGMLVGGGNMIRFDGGYPIPAPDDLDLPTASWITPALMAAARHLPVVWNAVGAYTGSPAAPWFDGLVRAVFAASAFIAVRDAPSKEHLLAIAPESDIRVVPDTAFYMRRLWAFDEPSEAYRDWKDKLHLTGPYVVLQANAGLADYPNQLELVLKSKPDAQIVILPISWCPGNREDFPTLSRPALRSSDWLHPLLIAEILAGAEVVVGSSLHLCITGLTYGVPTIRAPLSSVPDRKFEILEPFRGVAEIGDTSAVTRVLRRSRRLERLAEAAGNQAQEYWDGVAAILVSPSRPSLDAIICWIKNSVKVAEALDRAGAELAETNAERERLLAQRTAEPVRLPEGAAGLIHVWRDSVSDPNHAPNGFSHGDFVLKGVLQGWHWLTQTRPTDTQFGFQLGISDTAHQILFRVKRHGAWSDWRTVVGAAGVENDGLAADSIVSPKSAK